jgi:pimeloyl-ACP methyl ester carboxylesterase
MSEEFFTSVPLLFRQREILFQLGGELLGIAAGNPFEAWMSLSPEEYQSNWNLLYRSCERSCRLLWPELIQHSLLDDVPRLELPVTLLQGRFDYCTALPPAEKWLKGLSGSFKKELILFENSAHWPQIEENMKFSEIVRYQARSLR